MVVVNDYSNLSPEEARAKVIYLQHRIFTEQFHKSFFVRDPRPEYYLKYEIQAFLEGRITEFHGWTDPLGQALDFVYDRLTWWFTDFWNWTIKPGIEWILEGFRWIWDSAVSWAKDAYNKAVDVWNKLVEVYNYVRFSVYSALMDIWQTIVGLGSTIYNRAREAVSVVWDWINEFYNRARAVWDGITEAVSGAFETISRQVAALPQAIASAFQNAVLTIKDVLGDVWNNVILPVGERVKEGIAWFVEQLKQVFNTVWNAFVGIFQSIAPITPDRAEELGIRALEIAGMAGGGLLAMTAVWDILHPFKDVIPGELKAMIYDLTNFKLILGGMASALLGAALFKPLRYYYNYLFQPDFPKERDLREMLWRGYIDEEQYKLMLRFTGLSEDWAEKMLKLTELIPPPSDLVRFVVREVGLMPKDYPTPQFFIDAMKKHGYSDYWARAYWWSHWELPSFGQLQEAYFRDIITLEEFKKFIQWHDYSPTPRPGISKSDMEIMYELIFKMPDKLDARWMRRWGIIDSEEHKKLLKYEGLHPDWLDRVALAEKMNMLQDERNEIKSALRSQYLIGMITAPVLQSKLREILYTPEETEFLIRAVEERYKYELMKDAIDAAKYNYRLGKITLEELSKQLYDLGLSAEKVQKIVTIEAARAIEARREAYGESVYIYGRDVVIRRFREGLTTPTELESELRMIGYSDRQIPHLRTVALLERDYDFAMTVLSYVKTAYRKKKIDDTRFIEILRSFGFTDDKIQLELSLLKLAYGLGLEEEEVAS